jgi:hypothetical protein
VQALVVAAAGEDAAGVLVDDEDLAVLHDVVLVALEQLLGLDGVVQELTRAGCWHVSYRFSMPSRSSTFSMPGSRTPTVRFFSSTS